MKKITPREKISAHLPSYGYYMIISGDLNAGVPTSSVSNPKLSFFPLFEVVLVVYLRGVQSPISISLSLKSLSSKKF